MGNIIVEDVEGEVEWGEGHGSCTDEVFIAEPALEEITVGGVVGGGSGSWVWDGE